MKLIIGLGNPGEKYKNNRHNVGHLVIDRLSQMVNDQELMVKKTSVFMNSSGEVIKKLVDHYSLAIDHLYVIHDDLDIKLGEYKIQLGKGPKDHKGLASINQALSSNNYWHVRVGVDNRDSKNRTLGEEYVLQDFTKTEKRVVEDVVDKIVSKLASSMSGAEGY